ncbi:MAG: hypothetical protein A2V45_10845 [Candidatus Aminicenantes bacterium RBG_19FT_COMBO_58_17]|nr:MAG: hypothetical protein A2V45_10845 [Candidatus Aminicenantes bacterium RBG_19FT_COMBO_58_17]
MGWERERRVGKSAGKKNTLGGQLIDDRSAGVLLTVAAQSVRPERIYGDEEDVELFFFRGRRTTGREKEPEYSKPAGGELPPHP